MRRTLAIGIALGAALAVGAGLAGRLPAGQARFDVLAAKARGEAPPVSWLQTAILVSPERTRPTLRRLTRLGGRPFAKPLDVDLPRPMESVFSFRDLHNAPAPSVAWMDVHLSLLQEGETAHPAHVHTDEELILPLVGDLDFLPGAAGEVEERIGPGSLRYHASEAPHTLRAVGPGPAGYLIFKWRGPKADRPGALASRFADYAAAFERLRAGEGQGFSRELIFEGPTEQLDLLHLHASRLRPGGGYGAHADPYDVALVLLRGSFETLGERHDAPKLIFVPADIPHGMANPSDEAAEYLTIEFHGPGLKLGEHVH